MKDEIQNLKRLREIELEKAGKAMRDAQDIEERGLRDDLDRKDIRDEAAKKSRGKHALDRERQLQ